jgi:hypothetical protein
VEPGCARVRVEEGRGGHRVVIFRFAEAMPDVDVTTFLAVLDTAIATPASALALGGSEVGTTGDVIVQLTPGRYILGCVVSADGHRHFTTGEAKLLFVTNAPVSAGRSAPPAATQEVRMVDFAYVGPERWAADEPDDVAASVAGVARLGPGAVAYLPVELSAGSYVAYCLVTDPKTRRQHIELGVLRAIQVE